MKKTMVKRLMSWVLAAAMVVTMLPVSVLGVPVGGNVAKIGDTEYATLDEAIKAAADGDTIELLGNAELSSTTFPANKSLAINGGTEKYTVNANQAYLNIAGTVTFENCTVDFHGIPKGHWMYLYMAQNGSLTFRNSTVNIDGSDASTNTTAMYFPEPNQAPANFVVDNSTVTIKNCEGNGISWGGQTAPANNSITINKSNFVIDNCARSNSGGGGGFIGTFDINITDSTVKVINNRSYGSNGSNFNIKNSDVTFANNGSHGLSAGNLYISNSTVTADHNAYIGIAVGGEMQISDSSVVTVTENAYGSLGYAAMRLYNDYPFTIDGTSELYIKDNSNTGLYVRQGQLTVSDGAYLEITGNQVTNNQLHGYGGGIYVGYGDNYDPTVVLPADAKIYNNYATNGGDDIYVSQGKNGPSLTFGKVGTDWVLDDCDHLIDGWYQDGENARWQVCNLPEGEERYAVEYPLESETVTVTGLTALKAAHGYDPVDKASFPGLDKKVGDGDEEMNDVDVDAAAGQKVSFQLTSNVPTDLLNYLNPEAATPPTIDTVQTLAEERGSYVLTFHDVLDPMLTNLENYVVKIGDTELTTEWYEVLTPTDGCSFEISLDLVALYEGGVITDDDIEKATPITVTYDATLSEEAEAGTYENTAWVTAPDWETSKDIVYVNTYAIDIFKYDQADNTGLVGAEFTLTDAEGTVIATVTSGEDGHVVIDGLDAGTYYLKETQAPEGYVCSSEELRIVIPDDAGETFTVDVSFANSQIPHTGGTGTLMFTIGGIALMGTAGLLLVVSRKRRKA